MNRLTNLTPAEKKFLDDAIAAAERASGKKLNQPNRHIVLNRARAQIESQRYADRQRALREDERQQSGLPGHVRARRAADCAFWRFSGADTPKSSAIHPRA
jgi:acyl-CoA reductase-like NAD-dependent aldehyde dehydrogenase